MNTSSPVPRSVALEAVVRARRWLAEVEREAGIGPEAATWPTLGGGPPQKPAARAHDSSGGSTWGLDDPSVPASVDPPLAVPKPGTQIGRYLLEAEIGRGAHGSVFRARHRDIGRLVAVKILTRRAADDPVQRARLRIEAAAVHRVGHPAVADVVDVGGEDGPRPYLVLELLEGMTLHQLLRRFGPLELDEALELLAPVAAAVDQAHARGVLHRDLKPDNVFIERPGRPDVRGRLIDFGVARIAGIADPGSSTGSLVGTPRYMAPEVIDGQEAAPAADRYGFGVLLYEALVGRAPFVGSNPLDVLWQHLSLNPEPPSVRASHLPRAVDGPLLNLLEKRPAGRPRSLGEALARIAAVRR